TAVARRLALQVHNLLQHRVGNGHQAGGRLEAALGGDHVRELFGEIDVRELEAPGLDGAHAVLARKVRAGRRVAVEAKAADRTGGVEAGVEIVTELLQARRIGEVLEKNAVAGRGGAVGEELNDVTLTIDAEGLALRRGSGAGRQVRRLAQTDVANGGRESAGDGSGDALNAETLRGDEVALVIDAEGARAGHEFGTVQRIAHTEETVAGNAEVGGDTGAAERAGREAGADTRQTNAGADLHGRLVRGTSGRRRRGAERVAEALGKGDGRALVAGCIHIGDIVANDFEALREAAQRRNAGGESANEGHGACGELG